MSVKIDLADLKSMQANIEGLKNTQEEILKKAVNEIALRIYRLANKLTPVDTGWLRGGWNIGAIIKEGTNYKVEINNAVEYAVFVEYGHRIVVDKVTVGWVEGQFMMTIAEAEVERHMDRIVERIVERHLKEVFK